ncbi:hypothetical protein EG68_03647, partial [Paragonimus skrjabini miyazakii]
MEGESSVTVKPIKFNRHGFHIVKNTRPNRKTSVTFRSKHLGKTYVQLNKTASRRKTQGIKKSEKMKREVKPTKQADSLNLEVTGLKQRNSADSSHSRQKKAQRRILPCYLAEENSPTPGQQLLLTVQSQEEILKQFNSAEARNVQDANVAEEDSYEFNRAKQKYHIIQPVDAHLLTAKSGLILYDLADYIGMKMIGKKAVELDDHFPRRSTTRILFGESLNELGTIYNRAVEKQPVSYPYCRSLSKARRYRWSNTLLKPVKRPVKCYRPKARNLFNVNPVCFRKCAKSADELDSEIFTPTHDESASTSVSSPALRKTSVLSRSKDTKSKKTSKRSWTPTTKTIYPTAEDEKPDSPYNPSENGVNLMLDDVDTLTEDDIPADEGILTMLQMEDENDWEEVSLDLVTGQKSFALSKLHSDRPPYIVSKLPSLNTYTGLLKKMQTDCLIDVPPAILTMGRSEARTCIRRLLNLLSTECTFYSIYERNQKQQQIIFDLANSELSKAYSPQLLKDIRKRLKYISNGTKVVLNDHRAMHVLEERLEDLRKDRVSEMESNLEQLEADRIRLLLLQGLLNKEMLDAELLKQGELLHQKQRNDPVILMQKNRRGAKHLPVFCPNPLRDAYRVCHTEEKEFNSRVGEYEGITKLADPRKNSGKFIGKGRMPIKLEQLSSDSSYSSISYGYSRGFALRPVIPC